MNEETTTDNTEQNDPIKAILENPELLAQLKGHLNEETAQVEPDNDKVKANIQKAYTERDDALKLAKELQGKARESELVALEAAGKKDEADKMRMQELVDQLKMANDQVTGLTRDNALRTTLASLDFKSERAAEMAYKDMVGTLIQDASGNWKSPANETISEYAKRYASDDTNSFMFSVKQSSGSSSMATTTTSRPVSKDTSKMTGLELAQAYEDGSVTDSKIWI